VTLPGPHLEPEPGDLTPFVGAATDVAPLDVPSKPPHERTGDDELGLADWERVAAMSEFKTLLADKKHFIIPATIFFIVYYFALPVLVGYARDFMDIRVWGPVNIAYLFALSQFFMAWILAWAYVRTASHWDALARRVIDKLQRGA
jgi:uncharacterized membrane protein (DUF485 family)